MRIAIGADHAGFRYKERLRQVLAGRGHEVTDFGTDSEQPVDYPLVVRPVAEAVAAGRFDRGIVLGGSGNGEAIVANRVRGVRCSLCWSVESARLARQRAGGAVSGAAGQDSAGDDGQAAPDSTAPPRKTATTTAPGDTDTDPAGEAEDSTSGGTEPADSARAAQLARQRAAAEAARQKRVRDADPNRFGLRRSVLAEAGALRIASGHGLLFYLIPWVYFRHVEPTLS